MLLSYWFNWDFVYGLNDNWMSKLWMTGSNRSWDGGFFGPLSWGVAMMAGTLAYDLVSLLGVARCSIRPTDSLGCRLYGGRVCDVVLDPAV